MSSISVNHLRKSWVAALEALEAACRTARTNEPGGDIWGAVEQRFKEAAEAWQVVIHLAESIGKYEPSIVRLGDVLSRGLSSGALSWVDSGMTNSIILILRAEAEALPMGEGKEQAVFLSKIEGLTRGIEEYSNIFSETRVITAQIRALEDDLPKEIVARDLARRGIEGFEARKKTLYARQEILEHEISASILFGPAPQGQQIPVEDRDSSSTSVTSPLPETDGTIHTLPMETTSEKEGKGAADVTVGIQFESVTEICGSEEYDLKPKTSRLPSVEKAEVIKTPPKQRTQEAGTERLKDEPKEAYRLGELLSEKESSLRESIVEGIEDGCDIPASLIQAVQWRSLAAGRNLRGFLLARFIEDNGETVSGTPEEIIPSWACWTAALLAGTERSIREYQFEEQVGLFNSLKDCGEKTQTFFFLWVLAGILRYPAYIMEQLIPALPTNVFSGGPFRTGCFHDFNEKLYLPVTRGILPQVHEESDPASLHRRHQEELKKALAIMNPARNNFRNTMVKRFWMKLIKSDGPAALAIQAVERGGRPPAERPNVFASRIEGWDLIQAEYRNNIINRVEKFLEALTISASCLAESRVSGGRDGAMTRGDIDSLLAGSLEAERSMMEKTHPALFALQTVSKELKRMMIKA